MTPAARVQTAIEILDKIIASARENGPAADTIVADWFKTRRFAGSGDRRAIRELVYRAIRAFGEIPASGRAAMVGLARDDDVLAALFDGSNYGPAVLEAEGQPAVASAMPVWLGSLVPPEEHDALLMRAPLDLRANTLKTSRDAILAHFPAASPIEGVANGLRIDPPVPVEGDSAWQDGRIEIQDAGSQLVSSACRVSAGMTVVDLCAGGGGKTLALAASMDGEGRLIACDTDRTRLNRLAPRAARAGATVEVRLLDAGREMEALGDLQGVADVVLIDAPCSGSGTLRRNPEARWRLTSDRLDRLVNLQAHVLELAAPLVRPGGALIYVVCSLIEREGADQIARFLEGHEGWTAETALENTGRPRGSGTMLTPAHDNTDGFFVARLVRAC